MTKSTITREESVQAVFDLKVGYRLGFADIEILKRVARMALAAMDSEPVIVVGDDGGDALSYRRLIQSFEPGTKLYRHAQPVPVVPEEKPIPNTLSMYAVDAVAAIAEVKGWNACRAAMLQELKKVQELKRSAGVTKMCRCCTPNLRRNPIAARRKTSSFQRKAQSITVIYQSANAQGVRLQPESALNYLPTLRKTRIVGAAHAGLWS